MLLAQNVAGLLEAVFFIERDEVDDDEADDDGYPQTQLWIVGEEVEVKETPRTTPKGDERKG